MKRRLLFIAVAVAGLVSLASCEDKAVLPTQLPVEVQSFVKQYFPQQPITYAQKDYELFGIRYDVVLADGTQIDFNTDYTWDKIERQMTPIPAALVPPVIAAHIRANFPAVSIVKLDKERYGYEVELANGLELKYDRQGVLTEMDD